MIVALLDRHTDNDPLNKTDPLGLRPEDEGFGPCPDDFEDFQAGGDPCSLFTLGEDDPGFEQIGANPATLGCSSLDLDLNVNIGQADYGIKLDIDCIVYFSQKATVALAGLLFLADSEEQVFRQVCGSESIRLPGQDPIWIDGVYDALQELTILQDKLGVSVFCTDFLRAVRGDFRGRVERAASGGGCLGLQLGIHGPFSKSEAEQYQQIWGGQIIKVSRSKWGITVTRRVVFNREWVSVFGNTCHES